MMAMLREEVMVHEKLFPPGRVIHIRPNGELAPNFLDFNQEGLTKCMSPAADTEVVDNGCFSEIVMAEDMFTSHMPGPYLEACSKLS